MTTVNNPPINAPPVVCDFWWDPNGPSEVIAFEGEPYIWVQSIPKVEIRFFATLATEEAEDYAGKPHIICPPGVTITEYIWEFGDGTIASGPTLEKASHIYRIADPITSVKLVVVDSRNYRWSCKKPLNLTNAKDQLGQLVPNRIRVSFSNKPKMKLAENATTSDSAYAVVTAGKLVVHVTDSSLSEIGRPTVTQFHNHFAVSESSTTVSTSARITKTTGAITDSAATIDNPHTESLVPAVLTYFGGAYFAGGGES